MARLATWNAPIHRGPLPPPSRALPTVNGKVSFERAVEQWIEGHLSQKTGRPYSGTTKRNIRDNLLGGRCTGWREEHGLLAVDDWTADVAADYLTWYQKEVGADSDTVKKVRTQLRQFAVYCATHFHKPKAVGPALAGLRVSSATDYAKEKEPALTQAEVDKLLRSTRNLRDRLIVAMLLYTGMRPSELLGLEERSIRLDREPPVVEIRGTIHNPDMPKSVAGFRDVPLNIGQSVLPRLMREYLTSSKRSRALSALFPAQFDSATISQPLSGDGLKTMLQRLSASTGIHANAYRFRHTFCTWCADAGMHMLHLQTLLGHATPEMVAYYYRGRTDAAVLAAAARIRF